LRSVRNTCALRLEYGVP